MPVRPGVAVVKLAVPSQGGLATMATRTRASRSLLMLSDRLCSLSTRPCGGLKGRKVRRKAARFSHSPDATIALVTQPPALSTEAGPDRARRVRPFA